MSVLLSLITAGAFGVGDFFGGLSARRMAAVRVVAGSHAVGLVGVVIAAVLIDNTFTGRDLTIGAAAGLFGGLGVGLLYRGLARGPMSIVAPITAVTSAMVPAVWGVISGERFAAWGWAGIALALVAIWLVSSSDDETDTAEVSRRAVVEALLAGAGFGCFFIGLDLTETGSAPWPIVGARLATAGLLIAWMVARREKVVPPDRTSATLVGLTGLFDTGSNVLFLYALRAGDLTIVSVLSSLYPISTVVLAQLVLGERMTRWQLAGFAVAMGAVALIAGS